MGKNLELENSPCTLKSHTARGRSSWPLMFCGFVFLLVTPFCITVQTKNAINFPEIQKKKKEKGKKKKKQ